VFAQLAAGKLFEGVITERDHGNLRVIRRTLVLLRARNCTFGGDRLDHPLAPLQRGFARGTEVTEED